MLDDLTRLHRSWISTDLTESLLVLWETKLDVARAISTCCIQQDISNSRSYKIYLITLPDICNFLFMQEEQVFQEKGLHRCQDSTWTTLLLIDAIFHFVIEKEALTPRVMEVSRLISK